MTDKRAKIIATVGPACDQAFMLRALIDDGVDTFRLNFSHGEHARHAATITAIRDIEADIGRPIGILQDLKGPKIRLGRIPGGARQVEAGEVVTLSLSDTPNCLPLPHPAVFAAIAPGHRVLVDDGRIAMEVVSATPDRIEAKVIQGGRITDRKGVNLPDCLLDLPVLTEKDRRDLEFGLAHGVDWVALSFVQTHWDLDKIRSMIEGRTGLIAKIEKPSALDDIAAIVDKADAIMIARGDLGGEIPPEDVPSHQKEIIALCRSRSRQVIVATQMLESMTRAAAPTRAEASDVATAIYDGADAVMLSAETATGQFPRETVSIMRRIIAATEGHALYERAGRAIGRQPRSRLPGGLFLDRRHGFAGGCAASEPSHRGRHSRARHRKAALSGLGHTASRQGFGGCDLISCGQHLPRLVHGR
jgi:pyruvate kinase